MAEGSNNEDDNPYSFYSFSKKKSRSNQDDKDQESSSDVPTDSAQNDPATSDRRGLLSTNGRGRGNDSSKKEENPFSFKHFLNRDVSNSSAYVGQGVRPKTYSSSGSGFRLSRDVDLDPSVSHRGSESSPSVTHRVSSSGTRDVASALPDFVQDHLVIEQCYMNKSDNPVSLDLENLPDFALDGATSGACGSTSGARQKDTGSYSGSRRNNGSCSGSGENRTTPSLPLDLPSFDSGGVSVVSRETLPFDLPLVSEPSDEGAISGSVTVPASSTSENTAFSKTLPDFLSDGPMASGHFTADVPDGTGGAKTTQNGSPSASLPPELEVQRLREEHERLQRQLDETRRLLQQESRKVQRLEEQLNTQKKKDCEETATLEKVIEQVEENLRTTTSRAVRAESTITKLKQEIRSLNKDVWSLRAENEQLRHSNPGSSRSRDTNPHRTAQQLRAAASSAEHSLRTLLSGVESLKLIAASLENDTKIKDRLDEYLEDPFEDQQGPAL